MPLTPIYGLPYEAEGDQPLHSLTGGEHGTELILAEEVEDELERIDDDVTDVQQQLALMGLVHIAHHEVTTSTATVDLPGDVAGLASIPQVYQDLVVVGQIKSTATGLANRRTAARMRVNGVDAADQYRYQGIEFDGGASSTSPLASTNVWVQMGLAVTDDSSDNFFSTFTVEFMGYAKTAGRIMGRWEMWCQPGAIQSEWNVRTGWFRFGSTTQRPITSIQVFVNAGDVMAGTTHFDIYGRGRL